MLFLPVVPALFLVLLVGIGKEIKDKIDYNGWSWLDLLSDLGGILLAVLINLVI